MTTSLELLITIRLHNATQLILTNDCVAERILFLVFEYIAMVHKAFDGGVTRERCVIADSCREHVLALGVGYGASLIEYDFLAYVEFVAQVLLERQYIIIFHPRSTSKLYRGKDSY